MAGRTTDDLGLRFGREEIATQVEPAGDPTVGVRRVLALPMQVEADASQRLEARVFRRIVRRRLRHRVGLIADEVELRRAAHTTATLVAPSRARHNRLSADVVLPIVSTTYGVDKACIVWRAVDQGVRATAHTWIR
ncbi:hypothetical protein SAMN05421783_12167 [Thiocapsa roseopersicina]|uniref:Uncharacterized protein n=1 Tax=Thiocapsa roseopersicina TaxID=1058 RepID=A0A1H3AY55_THIRO|nr:hypothetical protein SAMN05421783_12167 [Thiocapsa roseopersicina]